MITIVSKPPVVALAGNPVRWVVSTNNATSAPGTYALLSLHITAVDTTPGHKLLLTVGNKVLQFVLVSTLTDDPLEIPVGTVGDTTETWGDKIREAFFSHSTLNENYTITLTDTTPGNWFVRLEAKEKGSDFTLLFSDSDVVGVSQSTSTAGVDPVYRDFFGILMKVWDINGRVIIGEDFKRVTDEGIVQFDLSEYLLAKVPDVISQKVTLPELPESGNPNLFTSYLVAYSVSFAEKYDGVARKHIFDTVEAPDEYYYNGYRLALSGGLSRDALVYYNEQSTNYFKAEQVINSATKRFLTWAPMVKEVSKTSIEKLFYFFYGNQGDTVVFHVKTTRADGSESEFVCNEFTVHNEPCVYELMVGYVALGLETMETDVPITGWKVCLRKNTINGTVISETRTFILDFLYYENERQLIFNNSLSAYDTIRITGVRETNNEYEKQTARDFFNDPETYENAPEKIYSAAEKVTYKASTGWLSLEDKNWLRDLLLSKEVCEISGTRVVKVNITSKKAFIAKDKENLYSLEFEYEKAFSDEYYSGDPAGDQSSASV